MRLASCLVVMFACVASPGACGGRVRDYTNPNVEHDATPTSDAGAPNDVSDVADAAVDTAPPACGCCGGPFAARLPDYVHDVLTTAAGEVIVGGNAHVPPGTGAGPLTLARIGDGGAAIWRREYSDERGMLSSLVESQTGGFALLRYLGTGNRGGQLIATDSNGTRLWSKTLGEGKSDFSAVSVAATRTGFVVVGSFMQPSPVASNAWLARYAADGSFIGEEVESSVAGWARVVTSRRGDVAMCGWSGSTTLCTVQRDDGTIAWRKTLSLAWLPGLLALNDDGELFLAGGTGLSDDRRVAVAKLDALGQLRWEKYFSWSKAGNLNPSSLALTPDGGFAVHGAFTLERPSAYFGFWYAARGDRAGAESWVRGYSFNEPKQSAGQAVAACKDGLVLVGHAYGPTTVSWIARTDEKGSAPIPAPGSVLDP